jgi:hypothetical protein
MNQHVNHPTLFTLVLKHPECTTQIIEQVGLMDITAIALAATPIKSVEAFPAQWWHGKASAQQIEDGASCAVVAHKIPQGFDVEFLGPGETPKWAAKVIDDLDWGKRQARVARRAEKEAQRIAALAAKAPKDTARKADAARERARGVVAPHLPTDPMFKMDARVRLVGV